MHASLIPAAAAMARFFPGEPDLSTCFATFLPEGEPAKVLLVEGDLVLDADGSVHLEWGLPELLGMENRDLLVGVIVTGNLSAPKATIVGSDVDWSPRVQVLGNLHVANLCLSGGVFEVACDVKAESTIFGFWKYGTLRVGGRTEAEIILSEDYPMEFLGEVSRRYAIGSSSRLGIPSDFSEDGLPLVLDPDLLDSYERPKQSAIIQRLASGGSLLRPEAEIGTPPEPAVSKAGRERLVAIAALAGAGEAIVEIDLTDCDLRFVPEEIRRYEELRILRLSRNNLRALPDWIGELPALEVLELVNCRLTSLPASLARHPRLRELDLYHNEIVELPLEDNGFAALETLRIGPGWEDEHQDFVANLDLGAFPRLRALEQHFGDFPCITFEPQARLWRAPTLQYWRLHADFDEHVPEGLAELEGLRGLSCGITAKAFDSALTVLPRLRRLEVLTLNCKLDPPRLAAIRAALPGVYLRALYVEPFESHKNDERHVLSEAIGEHVRGKEFAEAEDLCERLFGLVDLDRSDVSAQWLEQAMVERLRALAGLALGESDPVRRRDLIERYTAWAERVLGRLPKTPEASWMAHTSYLGVLRLECLIAKVDGLIEEAGAAQHEEARRLLDMAQGEAERHLVHEADWLTYIRGLIAERRGRLPG